MQCRISGRQDLLPKQLIMRKFGLPIDNQWIKTLHQVGYSAYLRLIHSFGETVNLEQFCIQAGWEGIKLLARPREIVSALSISTGKLRCWRASNGQTTSIIMQFVLLMLLRPFHSLLAWIFGKDVRLSCFLWSCLKIDETFRERSWKESRFSGDLGVFGL